MKFWIDYLVEMKSVFLFFFLLLVNSALAQQELPNDLISVCRTWGISFPEHQDKSIEILPGSLRFSQQFEVEIFDKQDDYEVVAYFIPHANYDGKENPVVHSMMKASHFASNEVTSHVAVHALDSLHVQNLYGADWGRVYYFEPKKQLSKWAQCQMVALEKQRKGIFYVLYFFDDISEDVEEMIWNPRYLSEH